MTTSGSKAHKIATLIEALGGDEIDMDEVDEMEPWLKSISELKEVVSGLARSVSEMKSSVQLPITEVDGNSAHNVRELSQSATMLMPAQAHPNMRDVIGILPEFEPLKKSLSSEQFVAKVEQLQRMYGWSEETILFAVQHKMRA